MIRLFRGLPVAVLSVGLALAAAPGVTPSAAALSAQELEGIDRRINDGRTAEARQMLLAWWDGSWSEASRSEREQGLWLRGRLTLDPGEASTSFRRMVTEYPVGRWTDQALYRLGTLASVSGDTLSASRWFTILERDFRRTTAASRARDWLAGAGEAVQRARAMPRPPPQPAPAAEQRSAADSQRSGDTRPSADSRSQGDWTIQLGAFAARGRASTFADDIRDAGFPPRVVQVEGSDLWRVRVGRFPDDADARALYDRIRDAGFDAAIVPGADQELSGG